MIKNKVCSNSLEQKNKKRSFFLMLVFLFCFSSGAQMLAATNADKATDPEVKNSDVQTREISGQVLDEAGIPLAGASILVENTKNGVFTDFDGKYKINVSATDKVLVFSFLGFETQKFNLTSSNKVNITLKESQNVLEEVVVTGYQTISKERATGSFVTIDKKVLETRPVNNVLDQLEGLSSGVNVSSNGTVEIRGIGSMLAGREPLYVIDGFPVSIPAQYTGSRGALATINPQDIETITVLKDASAASIWGVRASNGVIVITTKKGKNKEKLNVEFSSFLTIEEEIDYSKQDMASTSDVVDMKLEAISKGWFQYGSLVSRRRGLNLLDEAEVMVRGLAPNGDVWSQAQYNDYISNLRTNDKAAQYKKHLLRQPIRQTYNLSISGGSDKNNFYASMVYNNNTTHAVGTSDDRVIINMQDTYRLNDKFGFTAGINASIRNNRQNGAGLSGGVSGRPFENIVDENGQTIPYYRTFNRWASQERENLTGFSYSDNILDTQRASDNTSSWFDVRVKFGIDYKVLKNVKFTSSFQYEKGSWRNDNYMNMNLPSQRNLINNMYTENDGFQIPVGTQYRFTRESYRSYDFRNTLTWDQSWNNHELTVFAGTEMIRRFSDYSYDKEYGFNKQTNTSAPVNQADLQGGTKFNWNGDRYYDSFFSRSDADDREFSVFANLGYEYNNKYSVSGSFRIDQKNLFGSDPDFRYKPLWSVGLGWNMAKEDFMSNVSWVDRFRLKTTYGLSGNANNRYSPYAQATSNVRSWGGTLYNYLRLSQPANDQLKWEETTAFNVSAEFSLFGSKLNGGIQYYKRWANDLLGRRQLDVTNGWSSAVVNYASMENSGIELDLNAPIISEGDFKWNATMNLSYNHNEVTAIDNQLQTPAGIVSAGKLAVGSAFNNLWSFDYAGLNQYGQPMVNAGGTSKLWRDLANEPLVEEDLIFHGQTVAPYYGGLSNTFSYKNFDFTVNTTFKFGHVFRRNTGYGAYNGAYGSNVDKSWVNRWQQPGDEATTRMPAIAYEGTNPLSGLGESHFDNSDGDRYYVFSQDHIYKADFLRVRDVVVGYSMPKSVLDKIAIQSLRISANMQNPFLWVNNDKGYDPEAGYTMAYDNLKTFTIGVKATF